MSETTQNKKWIWEWRRQAFPWFLYIFVSQFRYGKYFPPVYALATYQPNQAEMYLDEKSLKKAAQQILNKVEKDNQLVEEWKKDVKKTASLLHQFCDRLATYKLSALTDKQLADLCDEAYQIFMIFNSHVGVIRASNRLLIDRISAFCSDQSQVGLLFAATKKSFFTKELEDLLLIKEKILSKNLNSLEIDRLIKKHTQKYFYSTCGYFGERALTTEDFKKKLEELLNDRKANLKILKKRMADEIKARRVLINHLDPPLKMRRLIEFGSLCTFYKDFVRATLNRLSYYLTGIFIEVGQRTGNQWRDAACLLPFEISRLLKNKKKIKRQQMVIYGCKKGIDFLFDKEAEAVIKKMATLVNLSVDVIKGTVANKGKAVGRVIIVDKVEDVAGHKDFVLITSMTTPDLMPAIKHAKAIVTDEGGLTCHAAIVSREMGIPCIVGAKIATKVLKDGDLVEVDAEKGIVRRI